MTTFAKLNLKDQKEIEILRGRGGVRGGSYEGHEEPEITLSHEEHEEHEDRKGHEEHEGQADPTLRDLRDLRGVDS